MNNKFFENLKYTFTPVEKEKLQSDLLCRIEDKQNTEAEKKDIMASINAKIKNADSIITSLADKIRKGFEYRNVECENIKDLDNNKMITVRLDTNEVVAERALLDEELQLEIKE